ncbi:hypothetical protein T484DRAFT_1744696 [Baffinella frigidus]|nr:hypothetical protein T484DRAFT_1744696 [Cryptophyta sp. CCMP2293]
MRQYHVEALLALRKLSSKPLFERVLEQMHVQPSLPDSGGVRVNLPCLFSRPLGFGARTSPAGTSDRRTDAAAGSSSEASVFRSNTASCTATGKQATGAAPPDICSGDLDQCPDPCPIRRAPTRAIRFL